MITNNERAAVQLSATKKDYYQIWNELLDLAGKISDRWDPTSTNESDPGIVLLKVLTALGDKLNYNIDTNILEAFMPSAAQAESMRKLCDMMGYNIKYYQSATTKLSFAFVGDDSKLTDNSTSDWQLYLPMFTAITNTDHDINYVTVEDKIISNTLPTQTIACMEGQVVRCESENNNTVTINQLDDHNRYYLPENQIAENGIFIYRINDGLKSDRWKKVENLNTQSFGSLIYKFGFDSLKNRPYLQFPEDIGQIIEDGLEIYYIRTSGLSGNISARVLNTFEKPSGEMWDKVSNTDFNVSNISAATNGTNIESIEEAYDSYKKTIGTFDTLVTCRDYMNAIYNMMTANNVYAVSNVVVSDIRDDINNAAVICGFDDYGIKYSNVPVVKDGINTFDLILYPFKKVYGLNTKEEYKNSFKLDNDAATKQIIEANLQNNKTIAHNIIYPQRDDIVCIKNYLKLDAVISTTKKVNSIEEKLIIETIKTALFEQFNARKLDFGEEIPFDAILECIENADTRIKNVALGEPILYTKFEFANGAEHDLASFTVAPLELDTDGAPSSLSVKYPGRQVYNKLALRNILAGRVELFNYNKQFRYDLSESSYDYDYVGDQKVAKYAAVYPEIKDKKIITLKPKCTFKLTDSDNISTLPLKLAKNELIKFRAPNFTTIDTYPAYVNYYLSLNTTQANQEYEIPATLITLRDFMQNRWDKVTTINEKYFKAITSLVTSASAFERYTKSYGALFIKENSTFKIATGFVKGTVYYCLPVNVSTFPAWVKWIKTQTWQLNDGTTQKYNGLYRAVDYNFGRQIGYLVDVGQTRYQECLKWYAVPETEALNYYKVQDTHDRTQATTYNENGELVYGYTYNGLGQDAIYTGIKKDTEYQLKAGEFLAINYTPSVEGDNTGAEATPINKVYNAGEIIRPNFELKDSRLAYEAGKKYQKTSGYAFIGQIPNLTQELPGMYSLGIHEQIEIRDFVKVELKDNITYLYWTLKDEENTIARINKQIAKIDSNGSFKSYTLQDGEYLYYTDINKSALAYYGSGTEVLFYNGTNFISTEKDKKVSADDILSKGLDIIPWIKFNFGNTSNDKKLVLKEYQYLTLADQDTLEAIDFESDTVNEINSEWQAIRSAKYTSSGITKELPQIVTNTNIDNATWQVKSQLALNISPTAAQALGKNDSIEVIFDGDYPSLILAPRSDKADGEIIDLSLKANYPYQIASDEINVKNVIINKDGEQEEVNDFALKLFEAKPIGVISAAGGSTLDPNGLQLNNFNDLWTTYFFKNMTNRDDYLKLYLNIPDGYFGLIMINCSNYSGNQDNVDITKAAYIKLADAAVDISPKIYNYYANPGDRFESWWKDRASNQNYYLRKGINIIKLDHSGTLELHPDALLSESIIFSNLDLIPVDNAINQSVIDYRLPGIENYKRIRDGETPEVNKEYIAYNKENNTYKKYQNITQFDSKYIWYKVSGSQPTENNLLQSINLFDPTHSFYYNCPLDATSAIDFNNKLRGTEDEEKLSDTHIWYDKNNINNNFVISELDADYLDKGLQIARASKL